MELMIKMIDRLMAVVVVFLSLFIMSSVNASDNGMKVNKDWVSLRACSPSGDFCVWRAGVFGDGKSMFVIDFIANRSYPTMKVVGLNDEELSSWSSDSDIMRVKLRVDRGRTYEMLVVRNLERTSKAIRYDFDSEYLGEEFIKELRLGSQLRIRLYPDRGWAVTKTFSLNGADSMISRAREESWNEYRQDYFDDDEPVGVNVRKRTLPETVL